MSAADDETWLYCEGCEDSYDPAFESHAAHDNHGRYRTALPMTHVYLHGSAWDGMPGLTELAEVSDCTVRLPVETVDRWERAMDEWRLVRREVTAIWLRQEHA